MAPTLESFAIDPKLPVRGVPFGSLKKLLLRIAPLTPIRYTEAQKLIKDDGVVLSARGESLKKSTFYHYWKALSILGFLSQENRGASYNLTEMGRQFCKVATESEELLTENEQTLFRSGMLQSQEIWDNFLILFTGQVTPTQTPKVGNYVTFTPKPLRKYILESPFAKNPILLEHRDVLAIIFGLRRWGQQCGLIDEIFPPLTLHWYQDSTSFMYLIDAELDTSLSVSGMTGLLRKQVQHAEKLYGTTLRFRIPKLLTHLCVEEGLRLETAQRILLDWVTRHPYQATIERPSSGLVEVQRGQRHSSRVDSSQPWLMRDGLIYTTLTVHHDVMN